MLQNLAPIIALSIYSIWYAQSWDYLNKFLTIFEGPTVKVEANLRCANKLIITLKRANLKLTQINDRISLVSIRKNARTVYAQFREQNIDFDLTEQDDGLLVIVSGQKLRFLENERILRISNQCNATVQRCTRNFFKTQCEVLS